MTLALTITKLLDPGGIEVEEDSSIGPVAIFLSSQGGGTELCFAD